MIDTLVECMTGEGGTMYNQKDTKHVAKEVLGKHSSCHTQEKSSTSARITWLSLPPTLAPDENTCARQIACRLRCPCMLDNKLSWITGTHKNPKITR